MSIIGISGHAKSGKDTVGKIIQILTNSPHFTNEAVLDFLNKPIFHCKWEIRKFADKLKDIVCLLINCDREQLEDINFKEKELEEEWWYYRDIVLKEKIFPYAEFKQAFNKKLNYTLIKPTPRLLLQLIGTECFRNIIHTNTWVNALMSEYKQIIGYAPGAYWGNCGKCGKQFIGDKRAVRCEECSVFYPNWIITDVRFPNELKAVKDKEGITIRVNRDTEYLKCIEDPAYFVETYMKVNNEKIELREYEKDFIRKHCKPTKQHESETALDNAEFDYVIQNDSDILKLIKEVRKILAQENII